MNMYTKKKLNAKALRTAIVVLVMLLVLASRIAYVS